MDIKNYLSYLFLLYISHEAVNGLKCPSCLHVAYQSGSVMVASMTVFVNNTQNSLCINSPDSVATTTCGTDSAYECGFLDAEIAVYAHLVGRVDLHYYYRDCVKSPMPSDKYLGCLPTNVEEKLFYQLWDYVPDSIISQQPSADCYCKRLEGCEYFESNKTAVVTQAPCPKGWFKFVGKCYEWWLILVIILDILFVLLILLLLLCCLCRRCPLYYRRKYYQDTKIIEDRREDSVASPGYYLGPALMVDAPTERTNIAMPGFGTPIVMEGGYTAPRNMGITGTMGYSQPGVYSSRLYQDDDDDDNDDARTTSTGRYTWRTTPRRFRTVYDAYGGE